jgi:hypothetical protein
MLELWGLWGLHAGETLAKMQEIQGPKSKGSWV